MAQSAECCWDQQYFICFGSIAQRRADILRHLCQIGAVFGQVSIRRDKLGYPESFTAIVVSSIDLQPMS